MNIGAGQRDHLNVVTLKDNLILNCGRADNSDSVTARDLADELLSQKVADLNFLVSICDAGVDGKVSEFGQLKLKLQMPVIPAKAGIQRWLPDPGFRRDDVGFCWDFGWAPDAPHRYFFV